MEEQTKQADNLKENLKEIKETNNQILEILNKRQN